MCKTAMVFFTLALVLASCFIAGCSSLPFSGTPAPTVTAGKIDIGVNAHENTDASRRFNFEDIVGELASTGFDATGNTTAANVTPEKHIKYIRGGDLDENGDAGSWTFVVEHGDQFSIATFDRQGVNVLTSPGTISRKDIFINQIISPRKLFEKNRAVISNTSRLGTVESRDISLGGGSYSLTISGQGSPRILVFDAKTGGLTSSND